MSLADGHPALALLYAELGYDQPELRSAADRHLRAAVAAGRRPAAEGLFCGLPALAFAARASAARDGDYAGLLAAADRQIAELVGQLVAGDSARRAAGAPHASAGGYDVVSGLTGLGRYLLAGGAEQRPTLRALLTALVADATRSDWWIRGAGERHRDDYAYPGLAHGVAGPLALLALATERGVRVRGQDEAVATMATWLLDGRARDAHGPYWPRLFERPDRPAGARPDPPHPDRTAWCHGPAGAAAALALAGRALGERSWASDAADALRCALDRPPDQQRVVDASLCHGWGGLLHITGLVARVSGDPVLGARLPELAARAMEFADPAQPYVFSVPASPAGSSTSSRLHIPGFLDGAAGTALALHAWLSGDRREPPDRPHWSAALLLS
ncbi:lanthionine synthetase C family protein [Streptomyces sp. CA-111067]|uniref:lanthionine synthetase C family protein n=1 Tax=Streptomyces sp. CA-111067 TaxID=3240046 RepID=UPI003D97AA75